MREIPLAGLNTRTASSSRSGISTIGADKLIYEQPTRRFQRGADVEERSAPT